jgi:swainsonine biosynthesis oxidoreductase SwnR
MKVAIAGSGNVATYLLAELAAYGHDVIMITRKVKAHIKWPQRESDYTLESLLSVLGDREALISTAFDYSNMPRTTELQLKMLEAVQKSATCKTFIPSEWTLNAEDYPEQPMLQAEHSATLHEALQSSPQDVRWTIICNSWFADYVLPPSQRQLSDIGEAWPMDHATKTFTILGPGTQVFDVVSVRDTAKAVAALLDSTESWEQYTYVSGQQLSWNDLFDIVHKRDSGWKAVNKPLADTVKLLFNNDPFKKFVGYFELLTYSGASLLPKARVERDRKKHFRSIKFRTVEEILDAAMAGPGEIV